MITFQIFPITNALSNVYENTKSSQLKNECLIKITDDLTLLAAYFGVSNTQAMLLSIVFINQYRGHNTDIDDFIKHFECETKVMLSLHNSLHEMVKNNFLVNSKNPRRRHETDSFVLAETIYNAIVSNEPMPSIAPKVFDNAIEVLEEIYEIGKACDDENMRPSDMFKIYEALIINNLHLPFFEKTRKLNLDNHASFIFYYVCWKTIVGSKKIDFGRVAKIIFGSESQTAIYIQAFIAGENELTKLDLLETIEATFYDDTEATLTNKSLDILETEGIKLFNKKAKKDSIILPENITAKPLYYNATEEAQVAMISQAISQENLDNLQNRLIAKALPTGIAILLHGAPGTGKTETVLQIAKQTNREVMKVDISASKSMWFGESEKVVKRIFTDYETLRKDSKICPILFFNEADAILGKRKDVNNGNVAQTENAIQNILLEEIENFKGILMATTNLTKNLDAAFERRFLFKVNFEAPSTENRAKIWHTKLPFVPEACCATLAENYDFSGGQIDNIIRKCEMNEILNAEMPSIELIHIFCNEELMAKPNAKKQIGFKVY